MELQVGVKALMGDGHGNYLFLKRVHPYDGETEPRWDIPGGRIEAGEPIFQALAREIKEETGLTMKGKPRILHAQDIPRIKDKHVVRLTFEVSVEAGDVSLDTNNPTGTGHDEWRWVKRDDIKNFYHDKCLAPVFSLLDIQSYNIDYSNL